MVSKISRIWAWNPYSPNLGREMHDLEILSHVSERGSRRVCASRYVDRDGTSRCLGRLARHRRAIGLRDRCQARHDDGHEPDQGGYDAKARLTVTLPISVMAPAM